MNDLNVFLIASPQEALAMKRIKEEKRIDVCFAVCYVGYTDSTYYELVKEILHISGIRFECIDLYNHRICINENKFLEALRRTIRNRLRLSRLIKSLRNGCERDTSFNFFCQEKSPLLDITKRSSRDRYYNLDHSPSDGLKRITVIADSTRVPIHQILSSIKKRLRAYSVAGIEEASKAVARRAFILSVRLFVRNYCKDNLAKGGYSWNAKAGHERLSYRDLQLDISLKKAWTSWNQYKSTVLLIDHPAQYKNVDYIRRDLESLDLPSVYADLCRTHCKHEERVVIKTHPYILQNASEAEVQRYLEDIKSALRNKGFDQVVELGEIVETRIHGLLPIESLKECLNINRFLGFFSSTMMLASCWSDVEVISDCRYTSGFRKLRDLQRRYNEYGFIEY